MYRFQKPGKPMKSIVKFIKDERGDALQTVLVASLLLGGFYAIWTFIIKDRFYESANKQAEWIQDGYEQGGQP